MGAGLWKGQACKPLRREEPLEQLLCLEPMCFPADKDLKSAAGLAGVIQGDKIPALTLLFRHIQAACFPALTATSPTSWRSPCG